MKRLGLLGGMSWTSTATYDEALNRRIGQKLGGHHSVECILYSVDFAPLEENMSERNWQGNIDILSKGAQSLESAGAEVALLCTNTMHNVFYEVKASVRALTFLHTADATAEAISVNNLNKNLLMVMTYTLK